MGSSELQVQQQLPAAGQQLYRPSKAECHDSTELQDEVKRQVSCIAQDGEQAYSLSWKEFHKNMSSYYREIFESEELVDVTLACEGKQIAAHKMVLAASSPFFRGLLKTNPCQHPIIILNEVRYSELTPLLHYMYHGEVNVQYDQISDFLRTAKLLQVCGLTGDSSEKFPKRTTETPSISPQTHINNNSISKDPERRSKTPDDRSLSPVAKRSKMSLGDSSEFPLQSGDHSSPVTISPPTLPPIPGLSLPLSMPSNLPASTSLPVGLTAPHHPAPLPPTGPFPHLFAHHYNHSDDASDTGASDPSEERPRIESEADDDQENSLEKMSGLANMAALKGLAGFPGPSGLMGLTPGAGLGSNPDHSAGG